MQAEMGNFEKYGPTWSRSSVARTRSGGLTDSDRPKNRLCLLIQCCVLQVSRRFVMFPCVVFLGFFLSLPFLLVYFPFLLGLFFNCQCILVIMAHSSDYVRIHPDRSRSRDDPPMWRHSNDSRSWNNQYQTTRSTST